MATRSGRPLYEALGFVAIEDVEDANGGVPVPLPKLCQSIRGTRRRKPLPAMSHATTDPDSR
jgi:hypothetical protein